MHRAWQSGDRAGAMQQISDRMVEALGVIGPAAACRDQIQQFAEAGIDLPIVMPFAPEAPEVSYAHTAAAFQAQVG